MGSWGFLFFGEKDEILIDEIVKLHRIEDKETLTKYYKEMLDNVKNELAKNKD